ncbi:hypothetical protein [Pseudomonas sp. GD03944]|uniref:hypothetical protein n=1 Tax=Pseudomonas sp. GD03944 TaxID=2975409 RepID=UPI002449AE47|nr:hypothetical protein [Pseudomonas sp. GD03944]MDH1264977.1 hypothetical protein [Pseudomonas sp. GD03944]
MLAPPTTTCGRGFSRDIPDARRQGASYTNEATHKRPARPEPIVPTLRVGMHPVTLRVTNRNQPPTTSSRHPLRIQVVQGTVHYRREPNTLTRKQAEMHGLHPMKTVVSYLLVALVSAAIGFSLSPSEVDKSLAFRLEEPAQIATPTGQQNYLLPGGTVVYHQASFDEGHSLYLIEVMFDGQVPLQELSPNEVAEPLWLYKPDAADQ